MTSDQPDFFCFAKKMVRLAAPHMKNRQEGPVSMGDQPSDHPKSQSDHPKFFQFTITY